jgi:hypothetical protein
MVDAMFLGLSFSKRNFWPLRAAIAALDDHQLNKQKTANTQINENTDEGNQISDGYFFALIFL